MKEAGSLAEEAVQETGFGNIRDKTAKNRFAAEKVLSAVKDMKTVGLLSKDPEKKLWEIGVPMGVIAAIVPSTNPTSTVCYKAIIALKAGCCIVFSPHPKALSCTRRAAELIAKAAEAAGAPKGAVSCLSHPMLWGCQELMSAPEVSRRLNEAIGSGKYDVIVINFANPDMVGHTGVIPAAIKAVEAVDGCVGSAVEAIKKADGVLFICADHGNAEKMIDYETGEPHTAHTTNPVPFILVNYDESYTLREGGCLADIAPTLIEVMGMEQPKEMTGKSLLIKK